MIKAIYLQEPRIVAFFSNQMNLPHLPAGGILREIRPGEHFLGSELVQAPLVPGVWAWAISHGSVLRRKVALS